jgi:hypothetical protein
MSNPPGRLTASGPCRCSRHSCWHARNCNSSGVVRVFRKTSASEKPNSSVVLCRECAAPSQRVRVS